MGHGISQGIKNIPGSIRDWVKSPGFHVATKVMKASAETAASVFFPEASLAYQGITEAVNTFSPKSPSWDDVNPKVSNYLGTDTAFAAKHIDRARTNVRKLAQNPHIQNLVKTPLGVAAVGRVKQHASSLVNQVLGPSSYT